MGQLTLTSYPKAEEARRIDPKKLVLILVVWIEGKLSQEVRETELEAYRCDPGFWFAFTRCQSSGSECLRHLFAGLWCPSRDRVATDIDRMAETLSTHS